MIGYETMRREPGGHESGRCLCGARVQLKYFTNDCRGCGQKYNWNGKQVSMTKERRREWLDANWAEAMKIPL